jgi:RNase P subunit RPR2
MHEKKCLSCGALLGSPRSAELVVKDEGTHFNIFVFTCANCGFVEFFRNAYL